MDDPYHWHDNLVYGIRFETSDPDRGLWRSDLVLDIDHIVEWVRGADGRMRFRVAPATLVFHDVTDLRISADYGDSGFTYTLNEMSIAAVAREPVLGHTRPDGRPYYRWRIELNMPRGGAVTFGASGYTQTHRAEPRLVDEQRLSPATRPPLVR